MLRARPSIFRGSHEPGYYPRIIRFSAMYPLFGVAAALLIVVTACTRDQTRARHRAHRLARSWLAVAERLRVLAVQRSGPMPGGGTLLVANHPTLIDIVLLVSMLPDVCCVLKAELIRMPMLRLLVRRLGWISNADPEQMLEEAVARLRAGELLIIFPEGTRTVPGQPMRFRMGAAEVAARAQPTVQACMIHYQGTYLSKQSRWHDIPDSDLAFHLAFDNPLPPTWIRSTRRASRRALAAALQQRFEAQLNGPDPAHMGS